MDRTRAPPLKPHCPLFFRLVELMNSSSPPRTGKHRLFNAEAFPAIQMTLGYLLLALTKCCDTCGLCSNSIAVRFPSRPCTSVHLLYALRLLALPSFGLSSLYASSAWSNIHMKRPASFFAQRPSKTGLGFSSSSCSITLSPPPQVLIISASQPKQIKLLGGSFTFLEGSPNAHTKCRYGSNKTSSLVFCNYGFQKVPWQMQTLQPRLALKGVEP